MYRPRSPFTVAMIVSNHATQNVCGVTTKSNATQSFLIKGSFKTYGGTEQEKNGLYSILDTADVETWFNPEIKSGSRITLADDTSKVYEIIGEPENIEMRCQFMKFKVQRTKGGI